MCLQSCALGPIRQPLDSHSERYRGEGGSLEPCATAQLTIGRIQGQACTPVHTALQHNTQDIATRPCHIHIHTTVLLVPARYHVWCAIHPSSPPLSPPMKSPVTGPETARARATDQLSLLDFMHLNGAVHAHDSLLASDTLRSARSAPHAARARLAPHGSPRLSCNLAKIS